MDIDVLESTKLTVTVHQCHDVATSSSLPQHAVMSYVQKAKPIHAPTVTYPYPSVVDSSSASKVPSRPLTVSGQGGTPLDVLLAACKMNLRAAEGNKKHCLVRPAWAVGKNGILVSREHLGLTASGSHF